MKLYRLRLNQVYRFPIFRTRRSAQTYVHVIENTDTVVLQANFTTGSYTESIAMGRSTDLEGYITTTDGTPIIHLDNIDYDSMCIGISLRNVCGTAISNLIPDSNNRYFAVEYFLVGKQSNIYLDRVHVTIPKEQWKTIITNLRVLRDQPQLVDAETQTPVEKPQTKKLEEEFTFSDSE